MEKAYFQTVHQIIRTGHWITDQISIQLKEFAITEPQYNVLRILEDAKGKPIAVQDILEKMVQRNSNITRIVDKLISKGLVVRKECLSNRRKMDISLTKEGQAFVKLLNKKVYSFHEALMGNLEIEELETLEELIIKLKSNQHV